MVKKSVEIKDLDIQTIEVHIKGTAPLIVHNFSAKSIRQIEEKQQGKAKTKKHDERKPQEDYYNSMYCFEEGNYKRTGFPATGYKYNLVRAAKVIGMVMTDTQGAVFVRGTDGTDLVEIKGEHRMRTDMIRLPNGSADVRYRAEYPTWGATLVIDYNAGVVSAEQIVALVKAGGFAAGIGEWRPQKSKTGSYGTYTVVAKEIEG